MHLTDIEWDLLVRYLADACTDEERHRFEQWLAAAPGRRAVMEGARDMLVQVRREVPLDRASELLASLRRNIVANDAPQSRPPMLRVLRAGGDRKPLALPLPMWRSARPTGLGIAAAALLLIGAGTLVMTSRQTPVPTATASAPRDVVAARGQRIAFRLPDGSAVVLAPGSRLRVPHDYGVRNRALSLVGEAAFTVVHDARRPFAVFTDRGVATDLGTRFVVREYAGDTATQVAVAEGKVELRGRHRHDGSGRALERGQLGNVGTDGRVGVRVNADPERYFAWAEGRLVLRDVPLREAAAELARWYDVDIRLASDDIGERRVSASAEDDPPGGVLRMVAASLGLELETARAGRVYVLRAR